jgi:hypothetical protein
MNRTLRILATITLTAAGLTWAHIAQADTTCPRTDQAAFQALEAAVTTGQYQLQDKIYYRTLVREAVQRDLITCQ